MDNLGKGTERVNAVLRLCGGLGTAQSFFESKDSLASLPLAWTAQALAFEADDNDFRQSFAEWPGPPHNMQVVIKAALSFLRGQLSVFTKLVGDRCRVSRGELRFVGLLVFVKLVVLVTVVRLVAVIYPYSILNSALNFHSYFTLQCFQCLPIPYSDISDISNIFRCFPYSNVFLFCTPMFPMFPAVF